jgi:hypothetical protein
MIMIGNVETEVTPKTTLVIGTKQELSKKKKTKKVQDAIKAKLPFFTADFLVNLCERKEEGIKLREVSAIGLFLC